MAPTNIKTAVFIKPPYPISRAASLPRSTRIVVAYPRPAFSATKRTNYAPISFDQHVKFKVKFLKATRRTKIRKIEIPRSMGGGGLKLVKPARAPASSRPNPYASLKKPHESCPFAAPCGPRRKENGRGQTSAFPSETFRFAPLILAQRGSALPWLVDDRAALRLRRIWCTTYRAYRNQSGTTYINIKSTRHKAHGSAVHAPQQQQSGTFLDPPRLYNIIYSTV